MKVNWKIAGVLVLILVAGSFLRVFGFSELPPGLYPDEAMNSVNALEALRMGQYKPFYVENTGAKDFL